MKRYGEEHKLHDELMETIATYMDDEIREYVHNKIAPCDNEEFLKEYCKHDCCFDVVLKTEFDIEL